MPTLVKMITIGKARAVFLALTCVYMYILGWIVLQLFSQGEWLGWHKVMCTPRYILV